MTPRGRSYLGLAAIALGALVLLAVRRRPPPAAEALRFVGEPVCASCHAREDGLWKGSHHQLAMQPANENTVLGDFHDAPFTYAGVTSQFFRRDGKFWVRTDGPDGNLQEYEITHTFGVEPLQQYLVPFSGGRLQGLEMAWDTRPAGEGGQRWFHLHPKEGVTHSDPLHWTGATENWNFMCADCHSTHVTKAFDPKTAAYSTRFEEMSVACEACHGPGSRHVSWARKERDWRSMDGTKGLLVAFNERQGVTWARDAVTHQPHRSVPRQSNRELETCARCHSRRGLIHEDAVHGQPLGDDYRVALLDDDLYFPDGQIKGEVYEYGSFLQSRMFAEGVSCGDCHDPHRPEISTDGDGVCLACHSSQAYASPQHHFHRADSPGSRCVECHMPATTYMGVDARRDHSLRVPRPDLSVKLGAPNACNSCHSSRSAAWAAQKVQEWFGHTPQGHQRFAETLAAAATGAPGSQRLLAQLVADPGQPGIARATAIERMRDRLDPRTLPVVRGALSDPDPLLRRAAVEALADIDPGLRVSLLARSLEDPVRAVRLEAASALAGVPPQELPPPGRNAQEAATAELIAAEALNADRPEAHLNLALLRVSQQRFDQAETALKQALAIDPGFVPAAVNLADLYRTLSRDDDAGAVLAEALRHVREDPSLLYALGLVRVRQKRLPEATELLADAARLDPGHPRNGYVYAVALHSAGRGKEALSALEQVLQRHPYDRDTLSALAAFLRESKTPARAQTYERRLRELLDAP